MNYEEYLLTHLIEECSEIIKAATKCQRFGKRHFWEREGMTNCEALAVEVGDANFLLDKLRELGWRFDSSKFDAGQRFQKALQISVDSGHVVLTDETTIAKRRKDAATREIEDQLQQPITGTIARAQLNQSGASQAIPAHGSENCLTPSSYNEPPPAPRASCEDWDCDA